MIKTFGIPLRLPRRTGRGACHPGPGSVYETWRAWPGARPKGSGSARPQPLPERLRQTCQGGEGVGVVEIREGLGVGDAPDPAPERHLAATAQLAVRLEVTHGIPQPEPYLVAV